MKNYQSSNISQKGQIVVILLMLMLVALSIGLAVTQKSITDVTTSTQGEQSSRAFSAAEAGIEKALTGTVTPGTSIPLSNDSVAKVDGSDLLPKSGSGAGIEYPPIGRETSAQFWMTNPKNPADYYDKPSFDLYFGNEKTTDKPAVELKLIVQNTGTGIFDTKVYYFDSNATRVLSNRFTPIPGCFSETMPVGILGNNHKFFCKTTVDFTGTPDCPGGNCRLILARARFLYSNDNHKLAIAPIGDDFPPQVQIYNATGTSGRSEKQIQAFKVIDAVPAWFDFSVFSVNEIRK